MLKFAFRNLLSRPVRSLLSLLGLTVAIVGMVGLFSVAEGIDAMVSDTFDRIPGIVVIQRGAPIPLFSQLPRQWGDEIEQVDGVGVVNAEIWTRVNLIEGERIVSPPRFFFGADIDSRLKLRTGVFRQALIDGRFLSLDDRGTLNTLISKPIAEQFEKQVGDTLRVNGRDLTIVGIYHCGSLLLDVAIIIDIDQLRALTRFDPDSVCCFYVEPVADADQQQLIAGIKTLLRGRSLDAWQPSSSSLGIGSLTPGNLVGGFLKMLGDQLADLASPEVQPTRPRGTDANSGSDPATSPNGKLGTPPKEKPIDRNVSDDAVSNADLEDDDDDDDLPVEIRSATDWVERLDEFSGDLDIFLTIMTSIGVTIAVLSIMNTMLMSVSERIIEIGILKANGWSKSDVMKLITFESAILGLCGGVLGSLLGWGATHVINSIWPNHVRLFASPGLLLFSLCFSTALGVFGGLYPAIWATRMMPMDAIRRG